MTAKGGVPKLEALKMDCKEVRWFVVVRVGACWDYLLENGKGPIVSFRESSSRDSYGKCIGDF